MQLVLEKRAERSNTIALVSPLIAIGLTLVTMSILFAILGKNPITALGVYFINPLTDSYSLQEIAVKASPLVMIAIGLSLCYLANAWNIGAEGQFLVGAKARGRQVKQWIEPVEAACQLDGPIDQRVARDAMLLFVRQDERALRCIEACFEIGGQHQPRPEHTHQCRTRGRVSGDAPRAGDGTQQQQAGAGQPQDEQHIGRCEGQGP